MLFDFLNFCLNKMIKFSKDPYVFSVRHIRPTTVCESFVADILTIWIFIFFYKLKLKALCQKVVNI